VKEDFLTYAQDSQEFMHWPYKLNHPSHTVMTKMAKQNMLPRRITKILTTTNNTLSHQYVISHEENTSSRRSSVSGPTGIIYTRIHRTDDWKTGKLTNQCIIASTVYVDHASDLSYIYHQTSMTSEETLKSKLAFEKFAASHGVIIKHYHADNGRFKDNLFSKLKTKDKPLASVE
jgi:hypothetical protein